MFALLCLAPDTTGRSIGMLTSATEEQAATRLVNGTMKPNRDARLILNAVSERLVTLPAAEVCRSLGLLLCNSHVVGEKKFSC